MKWKYQRPLFEIEWMDDEDIICTSGGLMTDDDYSGEEGGEL